MWPEGTVSTVETWCVAQTGPYRISSCIRQAYHACARCCCCCWCSALEFVWSQDSSDYAIREGGGRVKIFKNFTEKATVKVEYAIEGMHGGALIGASGGGSWPQLRCQQTCLFGTSSIPLVRCFCPCTLFLESVA